jgi:hypothetical protein
VSSSTPAATNAANSPSECPRGADESDAERLEHAEGRDVAREDRRLHELGGRERALVSTPGNDVASDRVRCVVEHRSRGVMGRPHVRHADEL